MLSTYQSWSIDPATSMGFNAEVCYCRDESCAIATCEVPQVQLAQSLSAPSSEEGKIDTEAHAQGPEDVDA